MSPFGFLGEFIEELLRQANFQLTEEQKDVYIPQLLVLVEERMGTLLLAALSEENRKQYDTMIEAEDASADEWKRFWHSAVPDFDDKIKEALKGFTEDFKKALE
ncbi:MAG: DUF5663 domain-containing protein [Patescibacteria group bacterium]